MRSGIFFRYPAVAWVGYNVEDIAVLTFEEGHIAIANKVNCGAATSLKQHAYCKVLVTIFASEAVHQQGSAAVIRQWHVVVRVDQTVAVDVTIFHIARGVGAESGVQPADKDFVKALADFCKETGIYLIVDEVQTGLGRTGKLYAYEHYDIEPDIFTLAKGLANGVPVGAMLAKSSLGEAFSYGSHGSTFGGNKLAMAAAKATLEVMLIPGFLDTALENGNQLQAKLQAALSDKETVTTVRGLGYMIGIETTGNLGELVQAARDKGLIVLTAGTNVIRLLPPITLSDAEIEKGVAILSEIFD